jgi:hypothetical protein
LKVHAAITAVELAALVANAIILQLKDEPALVGGTVVQIYSKGRYVSGDIDIVSYRSNAELKAVMEGLGFSRKQTYWHHPSTSLLVQFQNSPIMVGQKHVRQLGSITTRLGDVAVLSPLDCVLDRFAWYMGDGDREALIQAAMVAVAHRVDVADVQAWMKTESGSASKKKEWLADLVNEIERERLHLSKK